MVEEEDEGLELEGDFEGGVKDEVEVPVGYFEFRLGLHVNEVRSLG